MIGYGAGTSTVSGSGSGSGSGPAAAYINSPAMMPMRNAIIASNIRIFRIPDHPFRLYFIKESRRPIVDGRNLAANHLRQVRDFPLCAATRLSFRVKIEDRA